MLQKYKDYNIMVVSPDYNKEIRFFLAHKEGARDPWIVGSILTKDDTYGEIFKFKNWKDGDDKFIKMQTEWKKCHIKNNAFK